MIVQRQWSYCVVVEVIAVLMAGSSVRAQGVDRIHRTSGVDSGQITVVTPLEVTITRNGVASTVAAEDIEQVYLAGEPDDLNAVRTALKAGNPQEALAKLSEIDASAIRRDEISAEVEFFTALAKAQLAMAGGEDLAAAAEGMRTFMTRRRTSFHVPQAIETLGNLLLAADDYEGARAEYAKLAKANSAYFALRSAWLVGRAWQAEGKHAEALPEFERVIAATQNGPLVDPLKLAATLDRSVSQAATGSPQDAAETIAAIIAKFDPEKDIESLARAYVALGDCYLAAGDAKGALFAFLHVDLLYDDAAEAHARALHELVKLWREGGHADRAQLAAQELAEKYPGTRWAK
jgi:tetratricopeptide (TPR) repeat protein